MQDNAEWLLALGAVEFMRDVGKHFTVNYMLAKDSVKTRIDAGISYTEFSYMLLQAYDFLQLHRAYGATMQVGGSDQWGNITAGIELIRRVDGAEAHALTFPLVTTASGAKFGKTEAGSVWLDAAMTSPYRFYQFWINVDDRDVGRYLRLLHSVVARGDRRARTQRRWNGRSGARHRCALANEVTTRVHGADARRVAEEASELLFGKKDPKSLSEDSYWMRLRERYRARVCRMSECLVCWISSCGPIW